MRFSLGTLILFVVFVSSVYALMLPGPWYLARVVSPAGDSEMQELFYNQSPVSPDNTRVLHWFFDPNNSGSLSLGVFENKPDGKMLWLFATEFVSAANFRTDDEVTLLYGPKAGATDLRVFRRRFPEAPWGCAMRPEFALMVVTLLWLIVRGVRRIGRRARDDGIAPR